MTVTMFSITPPTRHTSTYFLRATKLNGPRTEPLPRRDIIDDARQLSDAEALALARQVDRTTRAVQVLEDIDDWYDQTIEDDGFLERLDRSAESVRFP